MEVQEEEVFTGPLSERLEHKNWKARLGAYEELAKLFYIEADENSPIYSDHAGILKKILNEKQVMALEKGLDVIKNFVDRAKIAPRFTAELMPLLIDKGLAGRPAAKAKTVEILLLMIEVDVAAPVITELVAQFKHKTPKVRAACIELVREAIRIFGTPTVPVKDTMKSLAPLFEDNDKTVRAEATNLAIELFKWLRDVLRPQIESLRPAQVKELTAQFDELASQPTPQPERYLRSQAAAMAAQKASAAAAAAAETEKAEEFDPMDLVEAKEILSKIPPSFIEDVANPKWQIRREAIEAVVALAESPKLASGDYMELVSKLKTSVDDKNIVVGGLAIKCIGLLAKGLRKDFASYARIVVPVLLEKFKEKKANVVAALHETLELVEKTQPFTDYFEDMQDALNNKIPQVKEHSLAWLEKSMANKNKTTMSKCTKFFAENFMKLMDDSNGPVRDNATKAMGRLMWLVGERSLLAYLEKIDKIKVDKIKEYYATLGDSPVAAALPTPVSAPAPTTTRPRSASAKPTTAPPKQPASTSSTDSMDVEAAGPALASTSAATTSRAPSAPPRSTRPASAVARRPAASKPSTSAAAAGKKPTASAASAKSKATKDDEEDLTSGMTPEEAEAKAIELVPEAIRTKLEDKNWKMRLEALEELRQFCEGQTAANTLTENGEVIVRMLAKRPSWKESNFQVLSKAFELVTYIVQNSQRVTKRMCFVAIGGLLEKIADIKIKKSARECLSAICEFCNAQFVFSQCYKQLPGKPPKTIAEGIDWMSSAVSEFSMAPFRAQPLIEFCKSTLENTNPAVKQNTIKLLCEMKKFMGEGLVDFLSDIKPALLSSLQAELAKVTCEAPKAIRQVKGEQEAEIGSASSELPRADIAPLISSKLLAALGDPNWKIRGEKLKEIEDIVIGANKRIQPTVGELFTALKKRVEDANKSVIVQTLGLINLLVTSIGPSVEKFGKFVLPSIVLTAADNKKNVASAAISSLEVWCTEITLEPLLRYFPKGLETPTSRNDILTFIIKHAPSVKKRNVETWSILIKPIIGCLQDKAAEVRKNAECVLVEIIQTTGISAVRRSISDLKPAIQQTLKAVLDKYSNVQIRHNEETAAGATQQPEQQQPETQPAAAATAAAAEPQPMNISPLRQPPVSRLPTAAVGPMRKSARVDDDEMEKENRPVTASIASRVPKLQKMPVNTAAAAGGSFVRQSNAKRDEAAPMPALIANNLKENRARRGPKWTVELEPRSELIESLKEQMHGCVSLAVHSKLFATDFRKQIDGINDISVFITPNTKREVTDSLDALFKYATLRVVDGNTSVLLKAVEFTRDLVAFLTNEQYQLNEYEAACFFPNFIDKMGNNNATIRQNMKQIVKNTCEIYSPHKVLAYLSQGLQSKNARSRMETAEVIGDLFEKYQADFVIQNAKAVTYLTQFVGDRDKDVRQAALTVIEKLYGIIGEQLFSMIGNLSETHKAMIDDKLKYSKVVAPVVDTLNTSIQQQQQQQPVSMLQRPRSGSALSRGNVPSSQTEQPMEVDSQALASSSAIRPPSAITSTPTATNYDNIGTYKLDMEKIEQEAISNVNVGATTYQSAITAQSPMHHHGMINTAIATAASVNVSATQPATLDATYVRNLVMNVDVTRPDESVQNLKLFSEIFTKNSKIILLYLKDIVSQLTLHIRDSFEGAIVGSVSVRLCKYVLNAMLQIFSKPEICSAVSREVIEALIDQLLHRLLDEMLPNLEDGKHLLRALNTLMLRILENADLTIAYTSLIHLLARSSTENRPKKFYDLVVKCILRLIKTLPTTISRIDLNMLLLDLHEFLTDFPPSKFRGKDDLPLRTVKTILNELVKIKGPEIRNHLALVPMHRNPLIASYIELMIANTDKSQQPQQQQQQQPLPQQQPQQLPMASPMAVPMAMNTMAMGPTTPQRHYQQSQQHLTPSQQQQQQFNAPAMTPSKAPSDERLSEIFRMIGNKETTQQGLLELYTIRKYYPQVDIQPYLNKSSEPFQQYIKRQLQKLAQQDINSNSAAGIGVAPTANGNGASRTDEVSPKRVRASEANSYISRLREFQRQYGMKPDDDVSNGGVGGSSNSVVDGQSPISSNGSLSSVDQIRARIKLAAASSTAGLQQQPQQQQQQTVPASVANLRDRLRLAAATNVAASGEASANDAMTTSTASSGTESEIASLRERLERFKKMT